MNENYGCECEENCGLVFSDDSHYDIVFDKALKIFKSDSKFSILHSNCPNLDNYQVVVFGVYSHAVRK